MPKRKKTEPKIPWNEVQFYATDSQGNVVSVAYTPEGDDIYSEAGKRWRAGKLNEGSFLDYWLCPDCDPDGGPTDDEIDFTGMDAYLTEPKTSEPPYGPTFRPNPR